MKAYTYNVGDIVWHGCRYWKQDELEANEVQGWNTEYVPYAIDAITPKRLIAMNAVICEVVQLNRQTMEREGMQYHSRYHEYFYAEKPDRIGDIV